MITTFTNSIFYKNPKHFVLISDKIYDEILIYSPRTSFENILPVGNYQMYLFFTDSTYFKYDSIQIQPNGINYYSVTIDTTYNINDGAIQLVNEIEKKLLLKPESQTTNQRVSESYTEYISNYNTGTLHGKVVEADGNTPVPFANIIIEVNGRNYGGATADFDGKYTIRPIPPGTYAIKASFVGYRPVQINDVVIGADRITFVDIKMESTMEELPMVEIVCYSIPLIDKGKTTSGETLGGEDLQLMSARSAQGMAATMGGLPSKYGDLDAVRGSRTDGTAFYVDGVRVKGKTQSSEITDDYSNSNIQNNICRFKRIIPF